MIHFDKAQPAMIARSRRRTSAMRYAHGVTPLDQVKHLSGLEFKVNFVRAMIAKTGRVRAEGRVIHPGNRAATAEGHLCDARGKLLAHATTTCLIFPV